MVSEQSISVLIYAGPSFSLAMDHTLSNMAVVSLPVWVFWRLGW
jgi:hypothetical protein